MDVEYQGGRKLEKQSYTIPQNSGRKGLSMGEIVLTGHFSVTRLGTLSVHWSSFLGPLLVGTNNCIPGRPHMTICFEDALTRLSWDLSLAPVLTVAHFSHLQYINTRDDCSLAA